MTDASIGDVVRIVAETPGFEGRIGHVVEIFVDHIPSKYQPGVMLSRDRYIVELIPIGQEPIVELVMRPASVRTLELHPLRKARRRR